MKETDSFDDFWDIEKLIPESKKRAVKKGLEIANRISHTYDTEPVDVILTVKEIRDGDKYNAARMRSESTNETRLSFIEKSESLPEPYLEYTPENPFINNVKIFKRSDFGYYSAFYDDGIRYLSREGDECACPRYFSYVPQYSQLDDDMLNFYFYMRKCLRDKKYIKADYSYVLLYIFELINVDPNKERALDQLCFTWKVYRNDFQRLDMLMKEWITDFCLINRLIPAGDQIDDACKAVLSGAALKELFICGGKSREETLNSRELAFAFLGLCTNYNWRKSKFATEENVPLFEEYIPGAIKVLLSSYGDSGKIFVGTAELKRDAFMNALCTPNNKHSLSVSYSSLSKSHEMRFLITDAVKHTENRIRAYLGIKSRLTVYSLPSEVRRLIDSYMDGEIGRKRAPKKEEPQEYEKLYDIPKSEFSIEKAKQIEADSWKTTDLLIEAFESEKDEDIVPDLTYFSSVLASESEESLSDEDRLNKALLSYTDFISAALLENGDKQTEIAKKLGKFADSIADEINEISAEIFGDILLEKKGNIYSVIEDYKEIFENE